MKIEELLTDERKKELYEEMLVERKDEIEQIYKDKLYKRQLTLINKDFTNVSRYYNTTEYTVDELLIPKINEQLFEVINETDNDFKETIKTKVEKRMKTLMNRIDINVLVGEK